MTQDKEFNRQVALTWAARADKADRVRELLKKGLDPYYQPHLAEPIFVEAVIEKRAGVVKAFLDFGINPNKLRSNMGKTVLEIATLAKENEIAGMLLDAGANPNIPIGDDGFSLLHHVVSADNAELTLKMLESGADLDALGPSGQTVQSYAAPHAREAILEYHSMKATKRLHNMHRRVRRPTPA